MGYFLPNDVNSTRKECTLSRLADSARKGDLSELTELWTEALIQGAPPSEMLSALKILVANGKTDDALLLAETAAEEMDSSGSPSTNEFITAAAALFQHSSILRRVLVESLRDRYMLYDPLERFMERSGILTETRPLNACWGRLGELLKLQEGEYLIHPTYGPGRIVRVSRSAFTIDFQKSRDHDMTLDAVMETTRPVDGKSIFVLSWKDPETLQNMINSGGPKLLGMAMRDLSTDGTLSRSSLTAALSGQGIDPGPFWRAIRDAAKVTEGYALIGEEIFLQEGSSTADRVRSILAAKQPALSEKARLIEGLLASDTHAPREELISMIPMICSSRCVEQGAAFELAWLLGGGEIPAEHAPFAHGLVESTASRVLRAMSEMHSQVCRKDYLALYLLSGPEDIHLTELMDNLPRGPRLFCRDILKDLNPGFLATYLARCLSDPSRVELHLWGLEQAAEAGDIIPPEEITGQILKNLSRARADTQKRLCTLLMNRLRPSFESHIASLDTRRLERLADEMDELGSAHETGLLLLVRRQINSRRTEGSSHRKHFWETTAVFSSSFRIKAMHDETDRLQQKDIPAAAEAIAEAAAHGDLSENAEYKAALERRDLLLDTLDRRRKLLAILRPYPVQDLSDRIVSPGTRVIIEAMDDSGDTRVLGIVGPLDTDPEGGWINYQAPLGAALLGRATGDTVTLPGEERSWRVSGIELLDGVLS